MYTIKDFILHKEQEEKEGQLSLFDLGMLNASEEKNTTEAAEKKEKETPKTEAKKAPAKPKSPVYEIVLTAEPDVVIRRKTVKTSQIMGIIVTQKTIYIEDEKTHAKKNVDADAFAAFFKDTPKYGDLFETGLTWLPYITGKKAVAETVMGMVNNYSELVLKHLVRINFKELGENFSFRSYGSSEFARCLNKEPYIKMFFQEACTAFDADRVREAIGNRLAGKYPYYPYRRFTEGDKLKTAINGLEAYGKYLYKNLGLDGFRLFIREWFATPQLRQLPDSRDWEFRFVLPPAAKNPNKAPQFQMKRFIEYAIHECVRQGYDYLRLFFNTWSDTLAMQYYLRGEIYDKYPKYLQSMHTRLSYQISVAQRAKTMGQDQGAFKDAVNAYKDLEWANNTYVMIVPEKPDDMIDEATQQCSCLASYIQDVYDRTSQILFMRKRRDAATSLVTVEVSEGKLVQAKGCHNDDPSEEEMNFLDRWCDKKGIVNALA